MENYKKNINFSIIFIRIHFILYLISYGIDIVNYQIILSSKYKSFFISLYIIIALLLILMLRMIYLLKSPSDLTDSIKSSLIVYIIMSVICLIFVIVEYMLIFQNFNDQNCKLQKKYKILFLIISLLYHVYNNLIFVFECYIITLALNNKILDRIQSQNSEERNENNDINSNNGTQSSETAKKSEPYIKEDTIYIIYGKTKEDFLNNIHNNIYNITCDIKNSTERTLKSENNIETEYNINKNKKGNISNQTNTNNIIIPKIKAKNNQNLDFNISINEKKL